ncbi:hypothetical protein QEZ54_20455 [Catellatospora sp. KI3]|uniref:hypothetical protein n=1 Tax=Catellatospora sp. KI3 TaxID=3041620 RepID=UPI0024830EB7|nr:hypothetical protein [Catellatospora sp. KI3]MDI1463358.1 hypothetical protein [Catellatospora sp. KI3]
MAELSYQVPDATARDSTTMFGWPEVRLWHTTSYVLTAIGRTAAAYSAQDTALALYGSTSLAPDRAKVELHKARCLIIDGSVSEGLDEAHRVLDHLPAARSGSVLSIARRGMDTVPQVETHRPAALALRERLQLTP